MFRELKLYHYTDHFTARWYDEAGKRCAKDIPKTITSEDAAKEWLTNWHASNIAAKPNTILIQAPIWLKKEERRLDISTYKLYKGVMNRWILDCQDPKAKHLSIQKLQIETELTSKVCCEWIHSIEKELAPNTLATLILTLGAFLEWYIEENDLDLENVAQTKRVRRALKERTKNKMGRTLIQIDGGKADKIVFEQEQINQLLLCKELSKFNAIRYLLAVCTGMRDGEIQGLKFQDLIIKKEVPCINLERQLSRWDASQGKETRLPKKESTRLIPVHPTLGHALAWWHQIGWKQLVGREPTKTDYIFPDAKGEPRLPHSAELLRKDLLTAKLPDNYKEHHYTMHAFRRTFASLLDEAGVAADHRQALLGHGAASTEGMFYNKMTLERLYVDVCKLKFPTVGEAVVVPITKAVG